MGRPRKIEILDNVAILDEVQFYDALNSFSDVIKRINDQASDGEKKRNIEKKMCRLIPAFSLLCGANLAEQPKRQKTMLHSNLDVYDGWGLCPKCGRKCIKVNENTILVNYPMFCKRCKKDYPVTWRYNPSKL